MLFGMVRRTSDEELVRRFKEGDRAAYSELVVRYQNRVFGMCLRWMGNRAVAEEVAQDVFLALYKALSRFRGDAQLSTWVYRVTVNHCKNRDLYRRRRAHGRHESFDGAPDDADVPTKQYADDGAHADAQTHQTEASELEVDACDLRVPRHEDDEGIDELRESIRPGAARVRVDRVERLADDLEDRGLLGIEQVVEAARADLGALGDGLQGDGIDPALGEQLPGRRQDALAGLESHPVARHASGLGPVGGAADRA